MARGTKDFDEKILADAHLAFLEQEERFPGDCVPKLNFNGAPAMRPCHKEKI
jgi:hypothetical protein